MGFPAWIVGSHFKYLACLDGRPVACLGWGSAAWKVAASDRVIGCSHEQRESNLAGVVNNVRFLILPWVKIPHLASKVLALNIRRLADDWFAFYRQRIFPLETFVDTARFRGTCYRAANWVRVKPPGAVNTTVSTSGPNRSRRCFSSTDHGLSGGAPWLTSFQPA